MNLLLELLLELLLLELLLVLLLLLLLYLPHHVNIGGCKAPPLYLRNKYIQYQIHGCISCIMNHFLYYEMKSTRRRAQG